MSKIKARIIALIMAALTVALIFSGIFLYRQQKETEKYYSDIQGIASLQYSEYRWSLDYLDTNLQKEVKSRRMQMGAGSSDEIYTNYQLLTHLMGTVDQMDGIYYGLRLNKLPRAECTMNDLYNCFESFRGFFANEERLISRGQIVKAGKNRYLVLKNEDYDEVVAVSKIVKKLNKIRIHASEFRIRSIVAIDEEWSMWKEIQSKNEEYIHSKEYDKEISNIHNAENS